MPAPISAHPRGARQGRVRQDDAAGRAGPRADRGRGRAGLHRLREPEVAEPAHARGAGAHQQGRGVLRGRGVPATTIHRILYTPLYAPEYERDRRMARPARRAGRRSLEIGDAALDRAEASYRCTTPFPGALASAGLRGSDFITGWKRRESPLDIGLIDEASMLDEPAATRTSRSSARWCCSATRHSCRRWARVGGMIFETLPEAHRMHAGAGPPAGGRQPDPRPRPMRWATPTRVRGFERDGRAPRPAATTGGWWSRRGWTPTRWRAPRCWSGATRRGCG
jgi:hypothetical protein